MKIREWDDYKKTESRLMKPAFCCMELSQMFYTNSRLSAFYQRIVLFAVKLVHLFAECCQIIEEIKSASIGQPKSTLSPESATILPLHEEEAISIPAAELKRMQQAPPPDF